MRTISLAVVDLMGGTVPVALVTWHWYTASSDNCTPEIARSQSPKHKSHHHNY